MSFTSAPATVDETKPAWRDVYLAAAAKAISYCGDFLAATALALHLQSQGDKGYGVAALMIAAVLPVAVLGPVAGRIADRVDSRVILVTTGLLQAAVCAVLAYTGDPVVMVSLVAVVSIGLALTQPTLSALTPEMVGRANLPRAMAIGQTANAVGMLTGPVLGGLLVGAYGVRPPLLADAASYLALALAGLLLRTRRGGVARTREVAESTVDTGWSLRGDRLLLTLMAGFGAVIAAVTAVNVAELFFVRETLGGSAAVYGIVGAGWTAGVLLGAWPFGKVKGGDRRLVLIEMALLGGISVVVLASAGVPAPLWLLPLYLVGGGLNAGLNVLSGTVVARRAPAAVRGRVFGVFAAVGSGANLLGYVIGGLLLPVFPPRSIMAGTGIAGILVAAVFIAIARRAGSARTVTPADVLQPQPATVG